MSPFMILSCIHVITGFFNSESANRCKYISSFLQCLQGSLDPLTLLYIIQSGAIKRLRLNNSRLLTGFPEFSSDVFLPRMEKIWLGSGWQKKGSMANISAQISTHIDYINMTDTRTGVTAKNRQNHHKCNESSRTSTRVSKRDIGIWIYFLFNTYN